MINRIVRSGLLFLVAVLALPAFAAGKDDEALWSRLASGGYVILIRHAATESGIGDPPEFKLDDCATQRNLSEQGRRDAVRLGEEFKRRRIPVAQVLTSRWCRCIDTATLAFGQATPAPMLDSMFNERGGAGDDKIRQVLAAAAQRPAQGNLVFVTHNQNIQALTGISTGSAEIVVATLAKDGKLRSLGRIDLFGR